MQSKIAIVGNESREKVFKGASFVAETIKKTIGPFGLNALIEKGNKITNDGYTISQELCQSIEDEFERRGAIAIHEVSSRTNEQVGDATSTSEALAIEIAKEARKLLPNDKSLVSKTPSQVIEMIKKSKQNVLEKLEKKVKQIESEEELISSALVSVENEEVAKLLGSAQWKLGKEGLIIAEETNEKECSIEFVPGIQFDNGYALHNMINNQEKQSLDIYDSHIILTNHTLQAEDIAKLKEKVINPLVANKKNKLIIIARAFSSETVKLCFDSLSLGFGIYPINAPYTDQKNILKDLQALTGARYIDSEEADWDSVYISDVGFVKSFVARRFDTIVGGEENEKTNERVSKRIEELEEALKGQEISEFEKQNLKKRIAQFKSGFAILKVGSGSLVDRKRLKDKCDDAVISVRLALDSGTIAGGGLALKEVSEELEEDDILKRPLMVVYNQIMGSAPEGFIIEDWVRDPFITIKSALSNACDFAGAFATTNTVIAVKNPPKCNHNSNNNEE